MDETTDYETIGSKGEALKAALPELIGAESTAVFLAEQDALRAAGVPASVAEVGALLPDAALVRSDGSATTLAAETAGVPAVLVFYRGAWCPFCNIALRVYQSDLLPALAARDVRLLAVSPQTPDASATLADEASLEFPVLSDPGNALARALGITMQPSATAVERLRLIGADMADFNADGGREIPFPSVVLVDGDLRVRFIDVHVDYSARTEPADVLLGVDDVLMTA